MTFLKKYKGYIIFAAVMIAALAAAFFFASPKNEPITLQSSAPEPSESTAVSSAAEESRETSQQSRAEDSEEISEEPSVSAPSEPESSLSFEKPAESSRQSPDKPKEGSQPAVQESSEVSEEHRPEVSEPGEPQRSRSESSVPSVSSKTISEPSREPVKASSVAEESRAESSAPVSSSPEEQSIVPPLTQSCTLYISCETAVNNPSLDPKKLTVLPSDGVILKETQVSFAEGESVFDLLKRICRERGIVLSAPKTPFYGGAYIEGISDLHERDCGPVSGWMYSVNGKFPSVGCSSYILKEGDNVKILYTCDLGADIGNIYMGGE